MGELLQEQEIHANFDYLSFYRRAFALITHIREKVLFAESMKLEKPDTKQDDPRNCQPLCNLFWSLKLKSKNDDVEAKGDEVDGSAPHRQAEEN